jgi:uncharacterized RDD family membrane protein YckC
MTDPAGGPPPPQGSVPPPPGAVPPPQGAVPPPQGGGNWQTPPPTAAPGGFQTTAVAAEAGPAPGIMYADLMNRIIALVIDAVILGVINFILIFIAGILTVAIGMGLLFGLFFGLIWAAVNLVYFVYGWTKMRASYGQKFLNLETVNAGDGATLTQNQAIRRWAFLWGPVAIGYAIPILGWLISFIAFFYMLYLLYTVSQSPKRQGFHDVQAGTVVVKRVA